MRTRAAAAGLPLPSYEYKAPYVVLTMYPDAAAASQDVGHGKKLVKLSEAERAGWAWLITRETVTASEYQKAMGLPERTARFHLKRLNDLGLVRARGAARSRMYEVVFP